MKLEKILSIIEHDFAVPEDEDYHSIASDLEKSLGSLNLDIRDNSFMILYKWCRKGIFADAELLELGNRMIKNSSNGLGEIKSNNVFLRSFSALVLCGVLEADELFYKGKIENRKSFLTSEILNGWLNQTIESFLGERDLRGYIEVKSWAHSIAHFADLFIQYAFSPHIQKDGHLKILNTIAKKLLQPASLVFNAYEDGRLSRIITVILLRNLISLEDFRNWLAQFESYFIKSMGFDIKNNTSNCNVRLNARTNIRLFLNKLYFMILFGDKELVKSKEYSRSILKLEKDSLSKMVLHTIKKIDTEGFYYQDDIDK
ncbi:MAG TPA: DUF2785 domain-containing protein [Candidatus Bathyarchaeia archaeon]|nr:DUF2785 domain-containing protein [Candidatus Bathyarchaeia archaeon]